MFTVQYAYILMATFFLFPAQWETESIKKGYSKVVDAYGCLGALKINLGKVISLELYSVVQCIISYFLFIYFFFFIFYLLQYLPCLQCLNQ